MPRLGRRLRRSARQRLSLSVSEMLGITIQTHWPKECQIRVYRPLSAIDNPLYKLVVVVQDHCIASHQNIVSFR